MADEKIITSSVFEQSVTEIMQDIANNLYEFEEYTEEEVANLIDLSEEEVAELTRVINDTTVALNKVYSNKKVEELLTELEVSCNKYADEKIGGLASIHLAYVDTLPTTGENNVIYILKSTTGGNDTLNLYNNGWISIGEFAVRLDNYYDKNQIDTLLNDKANKNEVVSQNDVVSDMSNISSSTVLSTAGLEVELNKKANDDEVVKKTDISTTIDNTSTDNTIPTNKAVYSLLTNSLKDVKIMFFEFVNQFNCSILGINSSNTITEVVRAFANYIINNYGMSQYAILEISANSGDSDFTKSLPNKQACIITVKYTPKSHTNRVQVFLTDTINGNSYIGTFNNSNTIDIVWKKVCTTTVADVGKTSISLIDSTNYEIYTNSNYNYYEVINGICYVEMIIKCISPVNGNSSAPGHLSLPIPRNSFHTSLSGSSNANDQITLFMGTDAQFFKFGTANGVYIAHFSYPVAE